MTQYIVTVVEGDASNFADAVASIDDGQAQSSW
ncbi:hypothetical protein ACVIGB_005391 [Bradyrhizobium sp. USDA 4341]